MKIGISFLFAAVVSASCVTAPSENRYSPPPVQSVDFGSKEAAKAYKDLPDFLLGQNQIARTNQALGLINDALNTYDLTPEGETLFIRKRLMAHEALLDNKGSRKDIERLIALDHLHKNEGPYLAAKLDKLVQNPDVVYERRAQALVRIPPRWSPEALGNGYSGHCMLEYDTGVTGKIQNIRVGYCTRDIFRQSSIEALSKWRYNPKIVDGKAVVRKNIETKIRYEMRDERGKILPE